MDKKNIIEKVSPEKAEQLFEVLSNKYRIRILNILLNYGMVINVDLQKLLDIKNHVTVKRHLDYILKRGIANVVSPDRWVSIYYLKSEWVSILSKVFDIIDDKIFLNDLNKYHHKYEGNRILSFIGMVERSQIDLTEDQKNKNLEMSDYFLRNVLGVKKG